jgi:hypothetical protein
MESFPQLVIFAIIDDMNDIEEPDVVILQLIADPKPKGILQRRIGTELKGYPKKILRPPRLL